MLRKSLDPDSDLLLDLDSMKMDPKHYRSWSRPEKRGKQGEGENKWKSKKKSFGSWKHTGLFRFLKSAGRRIRRIISMLLSRIRTFPGIQNRIWIFPGIQNRIRIFPGIRSTLVVLSLQIPSRFVQLRYYSLLCIILSPLCSPSTTWRSTQALGKPSTVDKIYRLRNIYFVLQ